MTNFFYRNRFLIARRTSQIGILVLFYLGVHTDWTIKDVELLEGNLSSSRFLEVIPLTDPFAALQIAVSGQSLFVDALIGAAIILGFYFIVGGRAFCSWVCPVNIISDSAHKLRSRWKLPRLFTINRKARYWILGMVLAMSAYSGLAAFEWISPIAIIHREIVFGMGMGWMVIGALFFFDLFVQNQAWCGHLCPLGAFYSLVGKFSLLRVKFDKSKCTKCGECHMICPEPQTLSLQRIFRDEMVTSGNCTNCGRCIPKCPEDCFNFTIRTTGKSFFTN